MNFPRAAFYSLMGLCCLGIATGQSLSEYIQSITSTRDDAGPALFFSNASDRTVGGHMTSAGTDPLKAYYLAESAVTDFFGNPNYAFKLESRDSSGGIAISGSTQSKHLTQEEGTFSLLFKTPSDLKSYQSLINRGYYNRDGAPYLELRIHKGKLFIGYNSDTLYALDNLQAETWYFVAVSFELSDTSNPLSWYLGQPGSPTLNSGSLPARQSGHPGMAIHLGGRGSDARFQGALEAIAIWNRRLSHEAILAQFNALGSGASIASTGASYSAPVVSPVPQISAVSGEQPSIILIVADDLGYGDINAYGNTALVPTPNLDRLSDSGVRFTDAYVTAPICGPSRYAILSGLYQQRLGVNDNRDAYAVIPEPDNRIPENCAILSDPLEARGYVSGLVGKWNLSGYPHTSFDQEYSVMHFGADYWPDESGHYKGVDEPKATNSSKKAPVWGPLREGDEYLTDRLGRQSVEFIEAHAGEPFFLYSAFNAPHSPLEAKKSHKEAVAHLPSEALRFYGAMVMSLDENVGRILDALERKGIRDNTIVAFISDNGPTMAFNVAWPEGWPKELLGSAGPLRGHKGQLYEGGIRVPMLISWPRYLKAGAVYDEPVSSLDFYPTFCAAAGVPLEAVPQGAQLDGVNLLPYLVGNVEDAPHERLYWSIGNRSAIRKGNWKLLAYKDTLSLYNLSQDISESNDLAAQYPQLVNSLFSDLRAFEGRMPEKANPRP